MSLAEACGWTLLRSALIAVCAVPVCFALSRLLSAARGRMQTLLWAVLLTLFFTPDLVIGYAYYNFSLSLIHHPRWNELFYALLLFFKVLPAGTAIVYFAPPPPISPQALFCRRLAIPASQSALSRLATLLEYSLRGSWRAVLPAGLLMFLLAFQEIDLVSLLNATSWTVWLFDQQAQGLPLSQTLQNALLPTLCQVAVIAMVLPILLKSRAAGGIQRTAAGTARGWIFGLLCGLLLIGTLLVCIVPFQIVFKGTVEGWAVLVRNPRLFREITAGIAMALAASIATYAVSGWLVRAPQRTQFGWCRTTTAVVLSLPGFCGALTIGLTVLSLFQSRFLNRWYDTPLPWFAALVLFLLPRAILLRLLEAAARRRESLFLAETLSRSSPSRAGRAAAGRLLWQLKYRGRFWSIVFLSWWAYLDPTLPSLLRPSGLDPAPMRLYNFMHYGQAGGLSAMLVVTLLAPIALIVALSLLLPPLSASLRLPWMSRSP